MARGRLRAIDAMIEKLTMESAGKTFEELAGERGGARVGRPRWLRILSITGGSSIPVLSLSKGRQ
jgi:hypothetical protein